MKTFVTHSPAETVALGRSFAASLRPGDVVALFGNLGSGKTSFVAGVCQGLGAGGHVSSPTFTLINEYPAPFGIVAHVDLYRIHSLAELAEVGVEEYFGGTCIALIEWAESAMDLLPRAHHVVRIRYGEGEADREISIEGATDDRSGD
jgi:tRNA threonylcarbamoyladenosine biosynthesis protein TsaE